MLINTQERHIRQFYKLFYKLLIAVIVFPTFVGFGDDYELSARLQDAQDLLHISDQIGPEEVCFHSGDEIKHVVGERQARDRTLSDFDAAHLYPLLVCSTGYGNTLLGEIDAVDLAIHGNGGELVNGPPSTAAHIENRVVLLYRDMVQSPVGHFGMMTV